MNPPFKVYGPFKVPTQKRLYGRVIDEDHVWSKKSLQSLQSRKGLYVFSIKTSRTSKFKPFYVGQAKVSFEQEVFNVRNLKSYNAVLTDFAKGYPAIFLLSYSRKDGKPKARHISQMESHFIKLGAAVNPPLTNHRGTKLPSWSISGVIRSKTRRASKAAKDFRTMFRIKSKASSKL